MPTEAPYTLRFALQAKSWDASASIGPCLVTADEADPDAPDFEFRVNGQLAQSCNTRDMLVKIPRMIECLSGVITQELGDAIFSGARGLAICAEARMISCVGLVL